jgi:hypothetical protein
MKLTKILFMLALPMVMLAGCSKKSDGGLKDTGTFKYALTQQIGAGQGLALFGVALYNGENVNINSEPEPPFDALMLFLVSYLPAAGTEAIPADGTYTASNTVTEAGTISVGDSEFESMYMVVSNSGPSQTSLSDGTIKLSHKGEIFTIEFDVTLDGGKNMTGVYVGPMQVVTPDVDE